MGRSGAQDAGEALPGELQHDIKAHDGPVLAVRFNRAGTYCLSAGRVRLKTARRRALGLCFPLPRVACRGLLQNWIQEGIGC
jgi:hypothetical protein